jgi:hypothetical protein
MVTVVFAAAASAGPGQPRSRTLSIGKAPAFVSKLAGRAPSHPPSPANAPYTVIASGLHAPRGLSIGPGDRLYVAEAGLGGGNNGAIDEIRNPNSPHPTLRPIVSGLASIISPEGDILGVSGLSAHGNGSIYAVMGESQEATGNPALGRLLKVTPSGHFKVVANPGRVGYLFTGANPQLDPGGQYPDANPYGVLALPGRTFVLDAGANTLNEVFANGTTRILAYFENNITADSTPTCAAQGPDGALYICTLSLVDSLVFGPSAKIYRVDPNALGGGNTVPIIGAANEWATALWPINGCAFGRDGSLYITELITASDFSGGDVVKIPFHNPAMHISLTNQTLPIPGGVAVGRDGTVYAAGLTVSPDQGFIARLSQH